MQDCPSTFLSNVGYWDEVAAVWTEQPLRSHMSAPGLLPLLAEGHQNSQLSTMLRQVEKPYLQFLAKPSS